jgi:hypothetical protein
MHTLHVAALRPFTESFYSSMLLFREPVDHAQWIMGRLYGCIAQIGHSPLA